MLVERSSLAHVAVPARHGPAEGEAGVELTARHDLRLTMLTARKALLGEARRVAAELGVALPDAGRSTVVDGLRVLWAGPEQWLVVAEPPGRSAAERLIEACRPSCMAVDQSDARAVIAITGPQARATLAKGFPIDLHPRAFTPGSTALTGAAGAMVQIWQVDAAPTYLIAVPLSFSEGFWQWLVHSAAEHGVLTSSGA